MDKAIITLVVVLMVSLIVATLIIQYLIKKDEEHLENNKRVIAYNRRTKEIKEIPSKEFEENKTWERIVLTHYSMFDDFIRYLRGNCEISKDDPPKYMGKAVDGAFYLRWHFRDFIRTL